MKNYVSEKFSAEKEFCKIDPCRLTTVALRAELSGGLDDRVVQLQLPGRGVAQREGRRCRQEDEQVSANVNCHFANCHFASCHFVSCHFLGENNNLR
jgi:hypothetical protein